MSARINGNAGGIWTAEEGTEVEVLEYAPNGMSVCVRMPQDARLQAKRGRKCWIPRRWLDGEEQPAPAPVTCPLCGQTIPGGAT